MTEERKERARKKEIRAKKWEEEVHQHLVAWGRSILVKCVDVALHIWPPAHEQFKPWARSILLKCIDISMHVWPPPAGLMYLFIKHKDKPGLRSFRRGGSNGSNTQVTTATAAEPHLQGFAGIGTGQTSFGTASRRRLWNPQQTQLESHNNDTTNNEKSVFAESSSSSGSGGESDDVASPPVEHDPCDSDFVPHGDKHNLEGYKVLSKRDASGTVKWLLKEKNGQVHESENLQDKAQEREDNCQIEVENAMDQDAITEEDRKFIASESDADDVDAAVDDQDEAVDDKYPDDDGGADSPIRKPQKKKRRIGSKLKTKLIKASEPAKRKRKPKSPPPEPVPLTLPHASAAAVAAADDADKPPLVPNQVVDRKSEVAQVEVDESDYEAVADLFPSKIRRDKFVANRLNTKHSNPVQGFSKNAPPPIKLPRLPPPPPPSRNRFSAAAAAEVAATAVTVPPPLPSSSGEHKAGVVVGTGRKRLKRMSELSE